MVRAPFYDKTGVKKGAWSVEEDDKLRAYIQTHGHWNWRQLPQYAGISRCGKSCRLRWINYLRPGVKRGDYTEEEKASIIELHQKLGNKWSLIAAKLPGRTDNEIKNYWHTHIKKKGKRHEFNRTSSGQGELKDHQEQSSDHEHSSSPSESSISQSNCPSDHNILESSPFLSAVLNNSSPSSTCTSTTEYSSTLSSPPPVSTVFMNCHADQGTDLAPSSETIIPDQDLSTGDFWTEPFLRDDMDSSSSSSYISFYDDGMDLFYQFMPTLQE